MRHFIRHPTEIPMDYCLDNYQADTRSMSNISEGGLSFINSEKLEVGAIIKMRIYAPNDDIQLEGRVVWNNPIESGGFLVGVKFNEREHYRARMIEQICYIEAYRNKIKEEEGRVLSSEEAANEWINRYADKFPD